MKIPTNLSKKSNKEFLEYLNVTHCKLHTKYESAFWKFNMGDTSYAKVQANSLNERDSFSGNIKLLNELERRITTTRGKEQVRLLDWKRYFEKNSTPIELQNLRSLISEKESAIAAIRGSRKEGYIDPVTKKFVEASELKMGNTAATHPDENMRKACFEACQALVHTTLDAYIEVIKLRNQFAQKLDYDDFYAMKAFKDEGMTKDELFSIFKPIYEETKFAFKNIRKLEETMPGLRKPWNFSYMLAGDFTKEEDPYFQFDTALQYWGQTFTAMGIGYGNGTLTLDLVDRRGKYPNGFCHQPRIVEYRGKKRIPGASNFTCTLVPGQVGEGFNGLHTLFHEGGHAAHHLNATEIDSCHNHEYPPMSVSLAETQSMFMDSICSSIEWRMRYAQNKEGVAFPFDLYERRLQKTALLRPLRMMSIMAVMEFERTIYETPSEQLTTDRVLEITRTVSEKYFDRDGEFLWPLRLTHIYSWDSSAYYHGYGLAEIAVTQWREYFHTKYGYIVDNPKVGKELTKAWSTGGRYSSRDFVRRAMKTEFDVRPYISNITQDVKTNIEQARIRITRLEKVPRWKKKVDLKATIKLVHGNKKIADSSKGFDAMTAKYAKWLATLK